MNRFNELLFNDALFSVAGNKDYIRRNYHSETRGKRIYNFPNGYKRFGLLVTEGKWLNMDNTEGEWPVAFTSVQDLLFSGNIIGKPNKNPLNHDIEIMGKQYKVAFQCRVNPNEIQYENEESNIYVMDRMKHDIIRPYGILIKEIIQK